MSVDLRAGFVALALLAGASGTAAAQSGVELGMDAGLSFDLGDVSAVLIEVPVQSIRAGFMVAEQVSIEPALGINYLKVEDEDKVLTMNLDLGALYHFGSDVQRGLYVRPSIGLSLIDVGGGSFTQFTAGAGVGTKIPIADRVVTRLEALYSHGFENDDFAGTDLIGARVGLSLFTR